MARLPELVRFHTDLGSEAVTHLGRLVAGWGVLADLSFADLLLFVPVIGAGGRFLVCGQVRPATSQTLHSEDLVGRMVDDAERPLVARAFTSGEIMDGEVAVPRRGGEQARVQCIPVRHRGEVVAVMTRESALMVGRRPGELERAYVQVFERLARMVTAGSFPYPVDEIGMAESPRVVDGTLLLDDAGRVAYASPNAISGLHRMGVYTNAEGVRLDEVGVPTTVVEEAWRTHLPTTEEVEPRPEVAVLLRCLPLLDQGRVSGGVLLLRDVTELRRRDRQLISKDATIREVHHRVKNNLQTIGSLLRLQGRRLPPGEGRHALEEAERRIRSIALVHEFLSRDASEQVAFDDIVRPLVQMAQAAFVDPDSPVRFTASGSAGELPAALATPLAVIMTELLQNAVEHAFPDGEDVGAGDTADGGRQVVVRLDNDGEVLRVEVQDNGRGFPEGFDVASTRSLGLSIARDLVTSQLGGRISHANPEEGGAVVTLEVPLTGQEH